MTIQPTITPENLDSQSFQPQQSITQVFARHETFHPRFGWLKKGFDRASQDSGIFLREDAPVLMGVEKNMVRSIRYWCSAFKILENDAIEKVARQFPRLAVSDAAGKLQLSFDAKPQQLAENILDRYYQVQRSRK